MTSSSMNSEDASLSNAFLPRSDHTDEQSKHRLNSKVWYPMMSEAAVDGLSETFNPKSLAVNPIKNEKRNSQRVKGITPEMRALCLIPLQDGWTREIRLRITVVTDKKTADIYYFAPDGTRFRSCCEITEYLQKNSITKYNRSNFSFYPEPLGEDCAHYEVVRKCSPLNRTPKVNKASDSTIDRNILMTLLPTEDNKEAKSPVPAKPSNKRKRRNPWEPIKYHNPNDKLCCVCTDTEWGQMAKCGNERCAIKLYHLECVVLREEPTEPWYCPICRDSDSRTLNPSYAS